MNLNLRKKEDCMFDMISLGEIMLRLDPGEGRIRTARNFRAWEGGGEYNVARGLRRCFGMKTAVVTAFADNEVGRLLEDFILQGGVDTSLIKWVKYDGIGRIVRNGSVRVVKLSKNAREAESLWREWLVREHPSFHRRLDSYQVHGRDVCLSPP